jgi:hypothetical protein
VYGYWNEYGASGQAEGGSGHLEDVSVHRETATDFRLVRLSRDLYSGSICIAGVVENR